MNRVTGFLEHRLDAGSPILMGRLPARLRAHDDRFEELWALHPSEFHEAPLFGRLVKMPRWQQTFGCDYIYTGSRSNALPVPVAIEPVLRWARGTIDGRLNGVLVNWYDGARGHYIGRHHDKVEELVHDAPIVTISLGERRVFRFRCPGQPGYTDFDFEDGAVAIVPMTTNASCTHEVPASKRLVGRRISVTLRAFEG